MCSNVSCTEKMDGSNIPIKNMLRHERCIHLDILHKIIRFDACQSMFVNRLKICFCVNRCSLASRRMVLIAQPGRPLWSVCARLRLSDPLCARCSFIGSKTYMSDPFRLCGMGKIDWVWVPGPFRRRRQIWWPWHQAADSGRPGWGEPSGSSMPAAIQPPL